MVENFPQTEKKIVKNVSNEVVNDKNCLKTRWKLCLSNFPANKGKLKLKSARKQG